MNKHISTAAAAVALLSAIGFASAQSEQATDPNASTATSQTQPDPMAPATDDALDPAVQPATPASAGGDGLVHPADPAVTPTTTSDMPAAPSTDSTMTTERAPQADRN